MKNSNNKKFSSFPWFILVSFSLLILITAVVLYFFGYYLIGHFFTLGFIILFGLILGFRDVINKTPIHKNSIYLGIVKAYKIPMLPDKINKFYNHIYIRILRFIGGFCLLLLLTKTYLVLSTHLHLPIIIMGLIQSIQIILIFLIKGIYGIYMLKYKSKEFEVKNSPLNHFATHLARILYCVKVGCTLTGGAAASVAAGASFDLVLESAGHEKVFVPMLGSMYKSIFGELTKSAENNITKMVEKSEPKPDEGVYNAIKNYNSLTPEEKLQFLSEINRNINEK